MIRMRHASYFIILCLLGFFCLSAGFARAAGPDELSPRRIDMEFNMALATCHNNEEFQTPDEGDNWGEAERTNVADCMTAHGFPLNYADDGYYAPGAINAAKEFYKTLRKSKRPMPSSRWPAARERKTPQAARAPQKAPVSNYIYKRSRDSDKKKEDDSPPPLWLPR